MMGPNEPCPSRSSTCLPSGEAKERWVLKMGSRAVCVLRSVTEPNQKIGIKERKVRSANQRTEQREGGRLGEQVCH